MKKTTAIEIYATIITIMLCLSLLRIAFPPNPHIQPIQGIVAETIPKKVFNRGVAIGQVWVFEYNLDNPFEDAKRDTMYITGVSGKYVQYETDYGVQTNHMYRFVGHNNIFRRIK